MFGGRVEPSFTASRCERRTPNNERRTTNPEANVNTNRELQKREA
jgi:hypothetical protein